MSKVKYLLIFLAIFLAVSIVITKPQAATVKGSTLKFDAKNDVIYNVKLDKIQDSLNIAGSISTDQIAALRFKNSGKLVWVGVKVGDKVRKGQAIASLDKVELQKNLQTQFNNYRSQLSTFDDTQDQYKSAKDNLLVTDTIKRILVRTQNSLDNSVINYEISDMALKESVLTTPIEGIVVSVDQPFAGSNITPATATFTVINPNSLYFKANIDQETITKLKVDQPATIRLDSYPDDTIDSKISFISFTPVTSETSTVYETRFVLPGQNIDFGHRIGMDGDVNIVLSQAENVLTVPTDAVNDDNGQKYVYFKEGNNLVRKNISIGIENDISTQVTEGLTQNDQVVVIEK
jgi:macrolide-specific efflux system membrane fusion protein